MKKIGFVVLTILFCTLSIVPMHAQEIEEENECVRKLDRAQRDYDAGLIENVEQMVTPCLNGTELSKDDKLRGYRLLALAHTYDGKQAEAEEAMKNFLKLEPEYQPQPGVDPKEFFELYNNYHTSPLYTASFFFGPNFSQVQSYKEFGAYNTGSDQKTYSSNLGFQVGVRGTRYIYQGLNLHLDLAFSSNTFTYTHDILESYTQVDPNGEPDKRATKGVTIESTEAYNSLIVPLSFSYTFLRDKQIRPYAMLGFEMRYLFSATNNITKSYLDQDIASVEASSIEGFKDERNDLTFSGVFGLGAKYKIKGGDLFLEGKYNLGISDWVSRDATPINEDQRLWSFYEQDNDFTLDAIVFNVGVTIYFYKPRKMKRDQDIKKTMDVEEPKQKKSKKTEESKQSKQRQVIE